MRTLIMTTFWSFDIYTELLFYLNFFQKCFLFKEIHEYNEKVQVSDKFQIVPLK